MVNLTQGLDILIVDDEPNIRKMLSAYCKSRGHRVTLAVSVQDALSKAAHGLFDLAFVDLRLGTESGLDLIPKLLSERPRLKIVVITAFSSIETAVQAIKNGAVEYLPKPFTPEQLDLVTAKMSKLLFLEHKLESLESELQETYPEADLTTKNPAMERCLHLARQAADSEVIILIRGESGTGKTVLARAIHSWSKRRDNPFTVISCPSLSPELLQSELFGHVKGAFTDAVKDNAGRISMSEGGTLFLDEIGDLPSAIQPKLLRFIQEKQYERVGESIVRQADARIVAATNRDLESMVKEGKFREDLLYRLNVLEIVMPPLRERPEDIAALAERFLAFFCTKNARASLIFTPEAVTALKSHSWPGNTRELRNVIERAVILCRTSQVGPEQFPFSKTETLHAPALGENISLEKIEEEHIRRVLSSAESLEEAAKILGIDQATLWRRRKQYGL